MRVAGLTQLVGLAGVGEREALGDADAQAAVGGEAGVIGELGPGLAAVGGEGNAQLGGADPVDEAVAVGDGDRAEGAQIVVVALGGGADDGGAAGHGELDADEPTTLAASCTSSVSPPVTLSVSSTRSEVSAATGSAAADSQSRPAGLGAKCVARAYWA
nr:MULTISPECIES: hypothetical protein [unclassified Frankia]